MSHKMLRPFIVKVSVLGYFPLYEYSLHLKVIKDDMVRNSLVRLFHYFGTATVKASSEYIDETNGDFHQLTFANRTSSCSNYESRR